MGTYTTNYNLFLPSIGEQGWGDLVNGNFSTIDATMKGLNTRVGTLETETNSVKNRVTTVESNIVSIQNELSTCLKSVKIPIFAKMTTTNEGYGVILSANTNSHNVPVGFSLTNPSATQGNASINLHNKYNSSSSGTINARNVFTNATRTLQTVSVPKGTTNTYTFSLQYGEVFYMTDATYLDVSGFVRPTIYAGLP